MRVVDFFKFLKHPSLNVCDETLEAILFQKPDAMLGERGAFPFIHSLVELFEFFLAKSRVRGRGHEIEMQVCISEVSK